jgi:hypothetical protein
MEPNDLLPFGISGFLRFILIFYSHRHQNLPNSLFPLDFQIKILYRRTFLRGRAIAYAI